MPTRPHKPRSPESWRRMHGPPRLTPSECKQARRLAEGLRDLWTCDDPKDRQDRPFDASDFR